MLETVVDRLWKPFWARAGRVPLRTKMIGIVVSALGTAGFFALIWFHVRMSHLLQEAGASGPTMELSEPAFVIILSIVGGFFVAWLLTLILTRPILDTTWVARRVHQGDLSYRAPVWANDEMGELAQSFNTMIDRLLRSQQALEESNQRLVARNEELLLLYALAAMSAGAMSAHDILQAGMARICHAAKADAGMMVWPSPGGQFELAAQDATPDELQETLRKALDGGFSLKLSAPRTDPLSPPYTGEMAFAPLARAARQAGFQVFCQMPVRVRDEVKGLLLLFFRSPQSADSTVVSLVNAACSQLAVAVENAALWEELKQRDATRAKLLAQSVMAQELERERISRELHDETGQALTSLLVQLKVLERLRDPSAIAQQAQELREIVVVTLDEVRRLARDLRPAMLNDLGLTPTLDGHIKTFRRKTNLDIEFEAVVSENLRLPRDVELALYRTVQEALTNVARHASATKALVLLEEVDNSVSLSISDNGCGFDVPAVMQSSESGVGLLGIRERVELIGGALQIDSAPGQGTRLRVDVDVKANGT